MDILPPSSPEEYRNNWVLHKGHSFTVGINKQGIPLFPLKPQLLLWAYEVCAGGLECVCHSPASRGGLGLWLSHGPDPPACIGHKTVWLCSVKNYCCNIQSVVILNWSILLHFTDSLSYVRHVFLQNFLEVIHFYSSSISQYMVRPMLSSSSVQCCCASIFMLSIPSMWSSLFSLLCCVCLLWMHSQPLYGTKSTAALNAWWSTCWSKHVLWCGETYKKLHIRQLISDIFQRSENWITSGKMLWL
jgi:hypothetical protein